MQIFQSPGEARDWCNQQRQQGRSIGFVATMGALHQGHISLVKQALAENDLVCTSIFVNPLQFNKQEDLNNYPRTFEQDAEKLNIAGCHMLFTGTLAEFFPDTEAQFRPIPVQSKAIMGLEGEYRPSHFQGVWNIVERLFYHVGNCRAYFGEKDFQQLMLIQELAEYLKTHKDNALDIHIVPCQTIREKTGLAMSSRNLRLSDTEQQQALVIYQTLTRVQALWQQGERHAGALEDAMQNALQQSALELEYAAIRDPLNWTEHTPDWRLKQARAFIAGSIGGVRLIDNLPLS